VRTPMPELPVAERIDSMIEVDQVISETEAKYESGRCLNCCRVCYDLGVPDKNNQNAA
jgi:formate dehydrogenase beta subunit